MKNSWRNILAIVLAILVAFLPNTSVLGAEENTDESEEVILESEDTIDLDEVEQGDETPTDMQEDSESDAMEQSDESQTSEEPDDSFADDQISEEPEDSSADDDINLASGEIASGTCGEEAVFTLSSDGVLLITGSGEVDDDSGWSEYLDQIQKVEVSGPSVLGYGLFRGHTHLKSIVLGNSVTEVGDYCFGQIRYDTTDVLESVQFGSGIQQIGLGAFYGNRGLKRVIISDLVSWCSVDIAYPREGKFVEDSVSSPLGYGAELILNGKTVTEVTIPSSVTRVGTGAFKNYKYLEKVIIPATVKEIGALAFAYTEQLSSVTFQGHAPEPEKYYYSSFTYSGGVFISGDENNSREVLISHPIGDSSYTNRIRFMYSANYMIEDSPEEDPNEDWPDVFLSETQGSPFDHRLVWPEWDPKLIAHGGCGENMSWKLDKKGVLTISGSGEMDTSAYYYNWSDYAEKIKQVIIEEGVTSIDDYAFCDGYETLSIWIPKSVTSIGERAIGYCDDLFVYYQGEESDWSAITIGYNNDILLNASMNYNSESAADITKFTLGRDNNSFSNSATNRYDGFCGVKNYTLSQPYYRKLIRNSSKGEINKIKGKIAKPFNGACYGISMSMGLLYEDKIDISDLTDSDKKTFYSLDNPYEDSKLLNNIIYYQLSQYLKNGGHKDTAVSSNSFSWLDNLLTSSEKLSSFLEKLVKASSEKHVLLLGVSNKDGAHAVLVTDCKYEQSKKRYLLTIYDQNTVGSKGMKGEYCYMAIAEDYSAFNLADYYGLMIDSDSYDYIYFLDWNEVANSIVKGSSDNSDHTQIEFPFGSQFKITTDDGKYLYYDGENLSGDLEIYDISTVEFGDTGRFILETSDISRYTINEMGSQIDLNITNEESFMSLEGSSIEEATIDLNEGIKLNGTNLDFEVFVTTDEVSTDENGLISVSGTAKTSFEVTVDGTGVTAEADEVLSNVETASYIGTEVTEREYTDIETSFSIDNEARMDGGTEVIKLKPIENAIIDDILPQTYTGKALVPEPRITVDGYELVKDVDIEYTYANNIKAGTATITITGIGNYTGTRTATFEITPKMVTPTVTLSTASYTYNGKAKKPSVTVKVGSTKLTTASYSVTYASGRKNVGKYKVTVKLKGNYSGSKTVYFKINPKGTTLATSTAASKAITVKWKKQSAKMATARITGYQIQLATNSKFTKNTKTVTVKGYSSTSKKVTKLKGKTKYYIRIRTYKTISGTKYYSPWSKAKTVTTKK